jgi:hypothetical protein
MNNPNYLRAVGKNALTKFSACVKQEERPKSASASMIYAHQLRHLFTHASRMITYDKTGKQ